jgi:hypothetical protein
MRTTQRTQLTALLLTVIAAGFYVAAFFLLGTA